MFGELSHNTSGYCRSVVTSAKAVDMGVEDGITGEKDHQKQKQTYIKLWNMIKAKYLGKPGHLINMA